MSPIWAWAPDLSRSCVAVCVTWPALQADSATGDRSSTPIVAARSARFTAVDLQRNGPATAGSVARGRPEPNGHAGRSAQRERRSSASPPIGADAVQSAGRAADQERSGRTGRRRAYGDGTALRRRPDGGTGRGGLGVRGPLSRPGAVGHWLP